MVDALLSYIAPHLCCGCGFTGTLLCDNCKYDIVNDPFDGCLLCGRPSRAGICSRHGVAYSQAWCVGERKDVLQRLIGTYKFQNARAAYRRLGDLLDEQLPDLTEDTVLVPIPTASAHIRERGYDHMQLIVNYLARKRHLPTRRLLERTGSATQHHSNRQKRLVQAQMAFRVKGDIDPSKHYIIIDDIVTTGASLGAAAQLLKQAGATMISVATIARQPLD